MVVRQHIAALVDDGAGAGAPLLRDRFEKPVQAEGFGGNVHDPGVIALVDVDIMAFVIGEHGVAVGHLVHLRVGIGLQLERSIVNRVGSIRSVTRAAYLCLYPGLIAVLQPRQLEQPESNQQQEPDCQRTETIKKQLSSAV